MQLKSVENQTIVISFSADEVAFLSNAINETLEAIEEWEFQTRTGETRQRATGIADELRKALDEAASQ